MTGLESIIGQITSDGQKEAQAQLDQAKEQAAQIAQKAQDEAAVKVRAALKDGERRAQEIRDRAQSAAELEQRNQMLVFKQELIRQAVDAARQTMELAPDDEYFDILLQLFTRFAQEGRDAAECPGPKAPARRLFGPDAQGGAQGGGYHLPPAP